MPQSRYRIYDAHAHLVSDDLVKYPRNIIPMRGANSQRTISGQFGPGTVGLPGGMHGPNPVNEKPSAERMHGWMAEENVVGIAAVQKGMIYRTDNSYIVDAADLFPDEMRAVIIVDPRAAETPQMIKDLSKRGIVGVRFFPINVTDKIEWLTGPASLKIWELVNDLGLVLDLEGPAEDGDSLIHVVEGMADKFPQLKIVLDHVFLPNVALPDFGIDKRYDGFAKRDNIFYKFTSLNMDVIREQGFDPAKVLRRVVDFYGPDKVMWGSDIGTSSGTYQEMIQRAMESIELLTEEERVKVLHDSGRRMFLGE